MTRTILIRPAGHAWGVRLDDKEGALMFETGAQAETAARQLARRFAQMGQTTDVLIYLRDGSLAGQLRATPNAPNARVARDDWSPRAEPAPAAAAA